MLACMLDIAGGGEAGDLVARIFGWDRRHVVPATRRPEVVPRRQGSSDAIGARELGGSCREVCLWSRTLNW